MAALDGATVVDGVVVVDVAAAAISTVGAFEAAAFGSIVAGCTGETVG
jgi:hypothetical protein